MFAVNSMKNSNANIDLRKSSQIASFRLKDSPFNYLLAIHEANIRKNLRKSTSTPVRTLFTQRVKRRHYARIGACGDGALFKLQGSSLKSYLV